MNQDRAPKRNLDGDLETVLPCKVAKCEMLVDCDQTFNKNVSSMKPNLSYIAMISMALQSVPSKQMLLSEIYEWISEHYPYYRQEDKSWRNSIRHNLSLNECFVKSGRSESGKGSYWSIHPANMEDFGNGDYRRRRARRRVRKCDDELRTLCEPSCVSGESTLQTLQASTVQFYSGYVPMSSTYVSTSYLNSMFGTEKSLNRENQVRNLHQTNRFILPNTVCLPNLQTFTGNRPSTEVHDTPSRSVSVNVNVNLDGFQPQFG